MSVSCTPSMSGGHLWPEVASHRWPVGRSPDTRTDGQAVRPPPGRGYVMFVVVTAVNNGRGGGDSRSLDCCCGDCGADGGAVGGDEDGRCGGGGGYVYSEVNG